VTRFLSSAKLVFRGWLGFVLAIRAGAVCLLTAGVAKFLLHTVGVSGSASVVVGSVVGVGCAGAYLWYAGRATFETASIGEQSTPHRRARRVFKYLLALPDGQPPDPAVFVTAIPNWRVGETFTVGGVKQFRIVAKGEDLDELEELYERGIHGFWVVEPVDA